MTERERRGRGRPGGDSRPGTGRKLPPPSSTGCEVRELGGLVERGTPIVAEMSDGRQVRGRVVAFTLDSLELDDDGESTFLRKRDIRYLYEDPDQADSAAPA